MTVQTLLSSCSSTELTEWRLLYELHAQEAEQARNNQ